MAEVQVRDLCIMLVQGTLMRLELDAGALVYINDVSEGIRNVSGWYLDVLYILIWALTGTTSWPFTLYIWAMVMPD